ncbi:MAG TPA: hypothetical protein VI968_04435 [archaeon]|nr:hypothetical protein [archaeon]
MLTVDQILKSIEIDKALGRSPFAPLCDRPSYDMAPLCDRYQQGGHARNQGQSSTHDPTAVRYVRHEDPRTGETLYSPVYPERKLLKEISPM